MKEMEKKRRKGVERRGEGRGKEEEGRGERERITLAGYGSKTVCPSPTLHG